MQVACIRLDITRFLLAGGAWLGPVNLPPALSSASRSIMVHLGSLGLLLLEGGQSDQVRAPEHEQHPELVSGIPVAQLVDPVAKVIHVLSASQAVPVPLHLLRQARPAVYVKGLELLQCCRPSIRLVAEPDPSTP